MLWIRIKAWLSIRLLTCAERGQYARWITRKVKTPKGLNAHDVCEIEWDRDFQPREQQAHIDSISQEIREANTNHKHFSI